MRYASSKDISLSLMQAKRIVRKVLKRIEHESRRKNEVWAVAPFDYRTLSYSDPVGELAVRMVMGEVERMRE